MHTLRTSTNIHSISVDYDQTIGRYVLWVGARWMVLNAPDLASAYAEVEIAFANGIMPQIVDIIINDQLT